MTKQGFIEAIKSSHQCEAIDDMEGFQLYIDGFFGDITILINHDDTFDINIDVFDEVYDMHDDTEKYHDAFTLACYKSVCSVLENKSDINHESTKAQSFDSNRGIVYSVRYLGNSFEIELIDNICEALEDAYVGVDGFYGDTYKQALLETIANDDDYNENSGFSLENNKLWFNPKGYSLVFTTDISTVIPSACFEDFIEVDDIYIGFSYAFLKNTRACLNNHIYT